MRVKITNITILIILGLGLNSIFSLNISFADLAYNMASTRSMFDLDTGNRLEQPIGEIPDISALLDLNTRGCPGEIAIYVHGIWATKEQAREQTERVFLSIADSDYEIPLVGFSWDSNTVFSFTNTSISLEGWNAAKKIANGNGPLLAQVILDFKKVCKNDDVRIIAHSLGSRVVLATLLSLHNNLEWTNGTDNNFNQFKIKSLHLLGAAVDNEQVSIRENDCNLNNNAPLFCSGEFIEQEVGRFYNLYNPEDNMLQFAYRNTERDDALSWCGKDGGPQLFWRPWLCSGDDEIAEPDNYEEYSVTSDLAPEDDADNDGNCDISMATVLSDTQIICTIMLIGDNHYGYLGYRDSPTTIWNNGAIDRVVDDWLQS